MTVDPTIRKGAKIRLYIPFLSFRKQTFVGACGPGVLWETDMNWVRLVAIIIGSGVASSLTDWFFAGDWIHRRYTYPEIWRKGKESRAIALTSPLPFVTCGVFAYVTARLGLHSVSSALKLAVAVWVIGPLPLILTNAAFMKLHRVFVVSYAIGWLTKLVIVATAVGWFSR
jgi:hypothetical protein